MMIQILNEISIDIDGNAPVTLWLVSYGESQPADTDLWEMFVTALGDFCGKQGWELECGDDPYREKSLAVFAQGFSEPNTWSEEDWNEWERQNPDWEDEEI